jgi:hypothetical protein
MKKQKTFKEISQSGLLIPTEYLDFRIGEASVPVSRVAAMREMPFAKQAEAVGKLGFSLFVKRAVIGRAKHVRVRPRFNQWSVSGIVQVIAPEITFDILTKLFDLAGRVGLCDWRPGCKTPGPYGMFEAKLSKA